MRQLDAQRGKSWSGGTSGSTELSMCIPSTRHTHNLLLLLFLLLLLLLVVMLMSRSCWRSRADVAKQNNVCSTCRRAPPTNVGLLKDGRDAAHKRTSIID